MQTVRVILQFSTFPSLDPHPARDAHHLLFNIPLCHRFINPSIHTRPKPRDTPIAQLSKSPGQKVWNEKTDDENGFWK